jgi:hypothetical protein
MQTATPGVIPGDPRYYDKRPRCTATGKVVFYFARRAEQSASTIQERTGDAWDSYECKGCRFYHVGHHKTRKRH